MILAKALAKNVNIYNVVEDGNAYAGTHTETDTNANASKIKVLVT